MRVHELVDALDPVTVAQPSGHEGWDSFLFETAGGCDRVGSWLVCRMRVHELVDALDRVTVAQPRGLDSAGRCRNRTPAGRVDLIDIVHSRRLLAGGLAPAG